MTEFAELMSNRAQVSVSELNSVTVLSFVTTPQRAASDCSEVTDV